MPTMVVVLIWGRILIETVLWALPQSWLEDEPVRSEDAVMLVARDKAENVVYQMHHHVTTASNDNVPITRAHSDSAHT